MRDIWFTADFLFRHNNSKNMHSSVPKPYFVSEPRSLENRLPSFGSRFNDHWRLECNVVLRSVVARSGTDVDNLLWYDAGQDVSP
jgi:hypothetical protein